MLHQRIKLLIEVHEDETFHQWCRDSGIVALDHLDDHLEDVGFNFITLESVMREHPLVESWQKHNVRQLCAMVIEKQRESKEPVERQNWKKIASDLQSENDVLKARLEEMEKLVSILQKN